MYSMEDELMAYVCRPIWSFDLVRVAFSVVMIGQYDMTLRTHHLL
jgi:hypothetical protein